MEYLRPILFPKPVKTPSKKRAYLVSSGLRNGLHLVAGAGSGKSRLLGRDIALQNVLHGKPQVIFDPVGSLRDNLLDTISRQPRRRRKQLWGQLYYLATGASDYLTPTPLYYRLSDDDTLFEIADRLPSIIQRQDPELGSAPILGWNALYECAIHTGMIAAVLGRQLDFVADLVLHPARYKEELKQALAADATLATAVQYFREMMDPDRHALREKQTGSFRTKLIPFLSDERFLATFCASSNGLDWAAAIAKGQTVFIDLQDELNPYRRQFKMLWYLKSFTDFIKQRGTAGRDQVVTLIIDEITQLLGPKSVTGTSLLAEDLEELVTVLARNMGVNVVIAHQNLSQIEERIQTILMAMGTQIIGNIASDEDARLIAQTLFPYDPYLVKKEERKAGYTSTWEFTADEQVRLARDAIMHLPKFEFFLRAAPEEGTITSPVRLISIANRDRDQYPDPARITRIRAYLRRKWGVPVHQLIEEMNQRRAPVQGEPKPKKKESNTQTKALPPHGTIGETAHAQAATKHNLSTPRGTADPAPSIATDIWNPVEKTPGE